MLRSDMIDQAIQRWLDFNAQFCTDEAENYTRKNILSVEVLHSYNLKIVYSENTATHHHVRLNLDDELHFVDLLFGYEDNEMKYLFLCADTWYTKVYTNGDTDETH